MIEEIEKTKTKKDKPIQKKEFRFIVDGVGIPDSRLTRIAWDGTWNSRGWDLYKISKNPNFLEVNWSNWQGEHGSVRLLNLDEALETISSLQYLHQSRYIEALTEMNVKLAEIEEID